MVATNLKSEFTGRHYPTRNDLALEIRKSVTETLGQTLAASLDLKTQVKQAHWNVKGMDFYQLHGLFDEMATELEGYVDMVAERITALGGTALGTARVAAARSILPEYPYDIVDGAEHVRSLAERYSLYAAHLRSAIDTTGEIGDADSSDLYTEISREIDKRLWFLEAHLIRKEDLGEYSRSPGVAPHTRAIGSSNQSPN
jgi:starvation-inducible DNA-binding protein